VSDDGAGALRFTPALPLVTTPGLLDKEVFDCVDRRIFFLLLLPVTATGGERNDARLVTGATLLFLFDLSAFFFDDDDDDDDDENSGIIVTFVFVVTVCCIGRSAIFDATESDGNSSTFFGDAGGGCRFCCFCCFCCCLLFTLPHDAPVGSDADDDVGTPFAGTPFAFPGDFPSSDTVGAIVGTTSFDQGLALVASLFFVVVIDVDNVIDEDDEDDDDAPSGSLRKSFTGGEGSGAAHAVFLCLLDPSFFSPSNTLAFSSFFSSSFIFFDATFAFAFAFVDDKLADAPPQAGRTGAGAAARAAGTISAGSHRSVFDFLLPPRTCSFFCS
jgi:hypothetical protein